MTAKDPPKHPNHVQSQPRKACGVLWGGPWAAPEFPRRIFDRAQMDPWGSGEPETLRGIPWRFLGAPGECAGDIGGLSERSWESLGRSWSSLGNPLMLLRLSWGRLARSLGYPWGSLGGSWVPYQRFDKYIQNVAFILCSASGRNQLSRCERYISFGRWDAFSCSSPYFFGKYISRRYTTSYI